MVFLTEKSGGDVTASRQQETIKFCQASYVHGCETSGIHGVQGIFVVDSVFWTSDDGNFYRTGGGVLHHRWEFLSSDCGVLYIYAVRLGNSTQEGVLIPIVGRASR